MATRSNIVVKVRPEDVGTTKKFDLGLLPKGVGYSKEFIDKIGEVELQNYMTIYHHWDGYISGLGKQLFNHYNDYQTILNVILGGDASTISSESITQYCAWGDEGWDRVQPKGSENCPNCEEVYIYLFEDGVWKVSTRKAFPEWKLLSEALKED